jgi:C1A family cysteine protease
LYSRFDVYDDFNSYSSGIYQHIASADTPYGHAVETVGYGVDLKTGLKYWKVKNSWGENWGENGYFKIIRGTNECRFERYAGVIFNK